MKCAGIQHYSHSGATLLIIPVLLETHPGWQVSETKHGVLSLPDAAEVATIYFQPAGERCFFLLQQTLLSAVFCITLRHDVKNFIIFNNGKFHSIKLFLLLSELTDYVQQGLP